MKNYTKLILIALIAVMVSCKKESKQSPNNINTVAVIANSSNSDLNFITVNSASLSVNISSDGGSSITDKGVCWNTEHLPTTANYKKSVGSGSSFYNAVIDNLQPSTTYYIRSYATNAIGTSYGNEVSLTTNSFIADIDGNIYDTIKIGTQVWMKRDLIASYYRNGDKIPQVKDPAKWAALTTGAWCWYNNDSATYALTYGKLYNWYAVNDPRGLAPTGYHIPSDAEWDTLSTFLGGDRVAGGKMKTTGTIEAGTGLWSSPNKRATNRSGFTGLPGGYYRYDFGTFGYIGYYGYWWSSTEFDAGYAWSRGLDYSYGFIYRSSPNKHFGFSVRCLRD